MEDSDTTDFENNTEDERCNSANEDWIEEKDTDDYSDEDDDYTKYSSEVDNDDYSEYSTDSNDELSSDLDDSEVTYYESDDSRIESKYEILRQNVIILGSKPNKEISAFFKHLFSSEYSFYDKKHGNVSSDEVDTIDGHVDPEEDEFIDADDLENNTNASFISDKEQKLKNNYIKTASNKVVTKLNTNQEESSDTNSVVCLHCEKIFENKQALIDHLIVLTRDKHLMEKEQEFNNESKDTICVNDLEFQDSNANERQEKEPERENIAHRSKKITILFEDDDDDDVNDETSHSRMNPDSHRCRHSHTNIKLKRQIDDFVTSEFAVRCIKPSKRLKF